MSIFNSIQHFFYKQALKRKKKTANGNLSTMNFSKAKSIAVIFYAGKEQDSDYRRPVLHYIESLRKTGKGVSPIAFFDESKLTENLGFDAFSKKELNWAQLPKGTVVEQFLSNDYDMLLCLYLDRHPGLEFLAETCAAHMKLGFYKGENAFQADAMVHNKNNDLSQALRQLDELLKMINN